MLTTQHQNGQERPLDESERAAIDKHGLHNLSDFRPKEPTEAEVKIIKELFEKSVDGEAYDLEKYGQYFRPAGVAAMTGNKTPVASAPATATATATETKTVTETVQPAESTPAPAQPNTDSAKRAEDILKLIRSRQAK